MASATSLCFSRFESLLCPAIEQQGLDLNEATQASLYEYWCLFNKWNRSYNLSAIRDPEEILFKHLVDSLSVQSLLQAHAPSRCIDVGTGGGLPGIVLALCNPNCHFTLLDSAGKKMRFLFQVCQSLNIHNVDLQNLRVEQFQPAQKYDVVISRAFASVHKFTALTSHLLHELGQFWAMKGVFPEQELREMEKHYKVVAHHSLSVPGVDGQRCLIQIEQS